MNVLKKKNIINVHLDKQRNLYILSVQAVINWDSSNMHFSLGLALSLVCKIGPINVWTVNQTRKGNKSA